MFVTKSSDKQPHPRRPGAGITRWRLLASFLSFGVSLLLLGGILALARTQARAAPLGTTIVVDTFLDELNTGGGNGKCSLREAIVAANTDQAVDSCPAGSGADTIHLTSGVYGVSLLGGNEDNAQNKDLDILDDLTILGLGADQTIIDGNGIDRIFDVDPFKTGINVSLSGMTIRNGDAGGKCCGGIQNRGTLTITASNILSNTASQKGGGIGNQPGGTLVLISSTVAYNESENQWGGGISSEGRITEPSVLTILNGTISNNTAKGTLSGGGGIFMDHHHDLTLNNTTITQNSLQAGDGGGVVLPNNSTMTITNIILAGNSDAGADYPNCFVWQGGSPPVSGGYNLLAMVDDCNWVTATGDKTGTIANPLDAELKPLADYGGGVLTHELKNGSPARNAGSPSVPGSGGNACEINDARGLLRPQGSACDIGAHENQASVDLSLSIADSPDPILVGKTLSYTLTIQKVSGNKANGVVLTDQLPGKVTFLSVTPSTNCNHSAGVVQCNFTSLSGNQIVTIRVRPTSTGTLSNTASVSANENDPVTGDNQVSEATTVRTPDIYLPILRKSP